jgi:5-hydroxyisourate hydrolase-like protein (transthyretin family)
MGLSTHVLDTMHGCPAAGMQVSLYTTEGQFATLVKSFKLNADGRNPDGPLYDNASLQKGTYRLVFDVAAYFQVQGREAARAFVSELGEFGFWGGRCHPALPCAAVGQSMELFHLPRVLKSQLFLAEVPFEGW